MKVKLFVLLATIVAVAVPAVARQEKDDAGAKVQASLQGSWNIVTMNGQNVADMNTTMTMTFTGNKYQQFINGRSAEQGTLKIDGSKKPMTITLDISEGSDAGKTQPGLLELKDDTLTLHFSAPGETAPPADFVAKDNTLLAFLKKVKTE